MQKSFSSLYIYIFTFEQLRVMTSYKIIIYSIKQYLTLLFSLNVVKSIFICGNQAVRAIRKYVLLICEWIFNSCMEYEVNSSSIEKFPTLLFQNVSPIAITIIPSIYEGEHNIYSKYKLYCNIRIIWVKH